MVETFTRGVNLRGLTSGLNMLPGEASDARDVIPREDGAVYTHFGWVRINTSALSGRPIGNYGFSYRGKNNDTGGGDTARPGNFAQASDGADFTRRSDEFSGHILLTTTTFYRFEPADRSFQTVALPGGVSVLTDSKPSFLTLKENIYIVGWADANLRYDPTDEVLYIWGWDATPVAPTQGLLAGGNLEAGKTYKYAAAFLDLYTGEESSLGAEVEATPTETDSTIRVTLPAAYAGTRHFNDLSTDVVPFQETQIDAPLLFAFEEFNARLFGIATGNRTRLRFSDLNFFERWRSRGYKELPVSEGNTLTAIGRTDTTLLVHGRRGGFRSAVLELGAASPENWPDEMARGVVEASVDR
jgi:hypothetical protein